MHSGAWLVWVFFTIGAVRGGAVNEGDPPAEECLTQSSTAGEDSTQGEPATNSSQTTVKEEETSPPETTTPTTSVPAESSVAGNDAVSASGDDQCQTQEAATISSAPSDVPETAAAAILPSLPSDGNHSAPEAAPVTSLPLSPEPSGPTTSSPELAETTTSSPEPSGTTSDSEFGGRGFGVHYDEQKCSVRYIKLNQGMFVTTCRRRCPRPRRRPPVEDKIECIQRPRRSLRLHKGRKEECATGECKNGRCSIIDQYVNCTVPDQAFQESYVPYNKD